MSWGTDSCYEWALPEVVLYERGCLFFWLCIMLWVRVFLKTIRNATSVSKFIVGPRATPRVEIPTQIVLGIEIIPRLTCSFLRPTKLTLLWIVTGCIPIHITGCGVDRLRHKCGGSEMGNICSPCKRQSWLQYAVLMVIGQNRLPRIYVTQFPNFISVNQILINPFQTQQTILQQPGHNSRVGGRPLLWCDSPQRVLFWVQRSRN